MLQNGEKKLLYTVECRGRIDEFCSMRKEDALKSSGIATNTWTDADNMEYKAMLAVLCSST